MRKHGSRQCGPLARGVDPSSRGSRGSVDGVSVGVDCHGLGMNCRRTATVVGYHPRGVPRKWRGYWHGPCARPLRGDARAGQTTRAGCGPRRLGQYLAGTRLRRVRLFFVDGFLPIHRCFCSRTITFRFVLRGDSAPDSAHPPLSGGQPGLITAPGRFGRPLRPPGHSRGVLVQCLGKGDASAMAVAATTRFSGRAFWVALGATSDRGRMDRHCRRAGEAPNTVRRWRES